MVNQNPAPMYTPRYLKYKTLPSTNESKARPGNKGLTHHANVPGFSRRRDVWLSYTTPVFLIPGQIEVPFGQTFLKFNIVV